MQAPYLTSEPDGGAPDDDLAAYAEVDLIAEVDLGEALRSALAGPWAGASPEALDAAVLDVFESLATPEAFSVGYALGQIGRVADRARCDPGLVQIAATALPLAVASAGPTAGPDLGATVANALAGGAAPATSSTLPVPGPTPTPVPAAPLSLVEASAPPAAVLPVPPPPLAAPPPSPASPAARGLVLSQLAVVHRCLLAAALGPQGRTTVDGVPVAAVLHLLGSELTRAAEEAGGDVTAAEAEALYDALLAGEHDRLHATYGRPLAGG